MRIAVLGATGHTGRHVLDLALGRGHHVTALVRSPDKLAPRERLAIVGGDPLDAAALAAALPGHDAVISVLGPPGTQALKRSTLVTDYARTLVEAMRVAGVERLAIISAAVLFRQRGLVFWFFRWLLRHHARDLAAMERTVEHSALTWTIARPGRLVESGDLACRTADGAYPLRGRSISFRAVAQFMLESVERQRHVRSIVGLAR